VENNEGHDTGNTVVIVDDDPGMRRALSILLGGQGYRILECASAEEALERDLLVLTGPCCFLLDVTMGEMSGLDLFYLMRKQGCHHKVVFLSGACDTQAAVDAFRDGAVDFVVKSDEYHRIVDAVDNAFRAYHQEAVSAQRRAELQQLLSNLTPRERQVAQMIAQGRTNDRIAGELSIAVNTVKVHRANIKRKLGVRTTAEITRLLSSD